MSRKNHKIIDGRLLQMDKKYSSLKNKQKDAIAKWLFEETKAYYEEHKRFPEGKDNDEIIWKVYEKIEEREIWIPYDEVYDHYLKKKNRINKRVLESLEHKPEQVLLTNMCMITDGKGNVLALDKVKGGYTGITFPGGHIEPGEALHDAIIREVREETGLTIHKPIMTGTYQWYKGKVRNVLLLYKAKDFSGELTSSDEGKVYWMPLEEFRTKPLAEGMLDVLEIMESDKNECVCSYGEDGEYIGKLY